MKTFLYYLLVTLMPTVLHASSDDGLFIPDRGVPLKNEVKNGKIVTTWKTERLKPIRVTFRVDTKNKQQYWLEIDFPKLVDPGDTYFFLIAGKQYTGFVARNEEKDRVTWALDIKNPAEGRSLLKKIAKIFELPSMMAVDQTIGEQAVSSEGHKPSSHSSPTKPSAPADAH